MSTKIPVSIAGNLVADPELTYGESGIAHTKLRVAVNQRVQGADGVWHDGEPVFHNVSAFRNLAENVANSLHKGDPVTVAGELEFRSYEKDGERREARRIVADNVGPDLRFGTAAYQRTVHTPSSTVQANVTPETQARADAEARRSFNVATKGPVVVPPFSQMASTEMNM